jgi:outer membrane protein TolC
VSRAAGFGAVLLLAAGGLQAGSLSLSAAMRQAASTSFTADAARLQQASAREATAQVKSLYLPELQFTGGHLNLDNQPQLISAPIVFNGMNLGSLVNPLGDTSSWRYKVSVQYLLYDFGKREKALAASRSQEEAVDRRDAGDVRRVQAEVAARYVALLHLKAQRGVLAQRRKALEDHLKTVQDLFRQGVVARNDLLRTEVALRSLGDAERALDSSETGARETLNVAMGLEPGAPLEVPAGLGAPPALAWSEAACRERTAAANEGLQALRAKVRALEDQTAFRRRDGMPNLVTEAFHSYEQNSYVPRPNETGLYLGVSWKVFDGARASRVRQSLSELDLGRREVQEAERQVGNAAAAAYRDFQVALLELKTSEANVVSAEENLRIVENQYKEGLAPSGDALDAEALLADSRFGLAARRYRAYTQQAALLAVMGEDLPAFYENATAQEL